MTIQSVFDPSFSKYGQVLTGYDLTGLLDTLERVTPVPEGTEYVPEQPELMALPVCGELSDRAYGGMPIQIGFPEAIGIRDLARPDYGDPVTIRPGEVPVFWPCGVTPQAAVMASRPDFCITHAPGHMFITDVTNAALKL